MPESRRVLLVANRTAMTPALRNEVLKRAAEGSTSFHLLVPASPSGLHRLVDPEVAGREEAQLRLDTALAALSEASGAEVTGQVGDADPIAAIHDTLHERDVDEIMISTLPRRLSRWMRLDLPSKAQGFGKPVTHVEGERAPVDSEIAAGKVA